MLTPRTYNLLSTLTRLPALAPAEISRTLGWIGLLAALVACGVPLVSGIIAGWSVGHSIGYGSLMLFLLGMTRWHCLSGGRARWLHTHLWLYLLLAGLLCLALQIVSGDPFIQPMLFSVPLVQASLHYSTARTASVAAYYLGLMVLGIGLGGNWHPAALLFPLIGYGVMMVFMHAFIRLSVEQASARQRADALAADLTRQRDYLARLVAITATLTHHLELTHVLAQVAAAGRTLANSQQVRVWLHAPVPGDDVGANATVRADSGALSLRLATAVPPTPLPAPPTAAERHTLLAPLAHVASNRLVLPLVFQEMSIGALELYDRASEPFAQADVELLQPFAHAAAIAIQNARLYEQARHSATLAERNRLARELHDTIAQGLMAAVMQLEAAQRSFHRDPERALTRLERARELARATLDDVRCSVWTLAAPLADGQALHEALHNIVGRFQERTGLTTHYSHSGPPPVLASGKATQVLRIVQEALQNVEKHAQADEVRVCSEAAVLGCALQYATMDAALRQMQWRKVVLNRVASDW